MTWMCIKKQRVHGIKMANKYMKRYSISLAIRKVQIKSTTFHYLMQWLNQEKVIMMLKVKKAAVYLDC